MVAKGVAVLVGSAIARGKGTEGHILILRIKRG